jgi:hypothetical protein
MTAMTALLWMARFISINRIDRTNFHAFPASDAFRRINDSLAVHDPYRINLTHARAPGAAGAFGIVDLKICSRRGRAAPHSRKRKDAEKSQE